MTIPMLSILLSVLLAAEPLAPGSHVRTLDVDGQTRSYIVHILPRIGSTVSWDGHLAGAVAGGMVAYGLTKEPRKRKGI